MISRGVIGAVERYPVCGPCESFRRESFRVSGAPVSDLLGFRPLGGKIATRNE